MPGSEWKDVATPFERGSVTALHPYPGTSWLPLLDGSRRTVRDSVVIENDDPTTGFQVRCLVTERYRLTVYPGTGDGELFDLQYDPHELHNLWYRTDRAALKEKLVARLLDAYSQHTPYHPIPPWNS